MDEAGNSMTWVRLSRFGDDSLSIRARPGDVAAKVRKARQIPNGSGSARFSRFVP